MKLFFLKINETIIRENIGPFKTRDEVENYLNKQVNKIQNEIIYILNNYSTDMITEEKFEFDETDQTELYNYLCELQNMEWTLESSQEYVAKFHNSNIEIKAGSGIREQMEVSNTISYNRFSMRLLEDVLSELSEGKLDWNERKFMLRTGERGAAQFNRAATAAASGWKAMFDNTNQNAIKQVSSKFHDNAFQGGFQFTEWRAPNNIHIMLEVDPTKYANIY